jgi:3-carboxy-cis,cis-muconate cycloisomerase
LSDPLLSDLFGDPDVTRVLSDVSRLQRMLDVEAALANVQGGLGLIPSRAATAIRAAARADLYDVSVIAADAARAGNMAIPLARHLTDRVASADREAAQYVHWGATSQDIIDTALVLQLGDAIPTILSHLHRAAASAAAHARTHAATPMSGRTWLQQATPITFGLKAAGWLDAIGRSARTLGSALEGALVLQCGGAAGTLAALGSNGPAVAEALAVQLGLGVPALPWHAHRERLATLACALGIACGTLGKIAKDLALLGQTDVGEVFEAPEDGRGGSSTMPQKRNPVRASVALSAAIRAPGLVATMLTAMPQEHERGLGGWQAEWETLPELVRVTAGSARAMAEALERLVVDSARMRENLDRTEGLAMAEAIVMALAPQIGKSVAHARVEAASHRAIAERRPLADMLEEETDVTRVIGRAEIDRLLSPEQYLGAAAVFIERALAAHESERKRDA